MSTFDSIKPTAMGRKTKNKWQETQSNKSHLPLCSVNTFKATFFDSFGTLDDLLMRLARNEDPAPNVLPPGIVLLLANAQLADDDRFVLFEPICCAFSPDVIELQLLPEAEAAAAAAAADDDDDDAPRPSFTCWAPILCGGFLFYYSTHKKKPSNSMHKAHTRSHVRKKKETISRNVSFFSLISYAPRLSIDSFNFELNCVNSGTGWLFIIRFSLFSFLLFCCLLKLLFWLLSLLWCCYA